MKKTGRILPSTRFDTEATVFSYNEWHKDKTLFVSPLPQLNDFDRRPTF